MRRREFIVLIGGVATWPLEARAKEAIRRLGVEMAQAERDPAVQARLAAFQEALAALGWSEGRNLRSEIRWAAGDPSRMRTQAAELASLRLDAILAYSTPALTALKQATRTTPLVFVVVNDPVAQGFVSNLAHPGENITGFSFMDYSVLGKGIELLKKLAPDMRRVGFIFNPDTYPYYEVYLRSLLESQSALAVAVIPLRIRSETDIREMITDLARETGAGLITPPDPYVASRRQLIISLAQQYRLPTAFTNREAVADGALMSYGPDQTDIFRRSAVYVDRIFKGEAPAGLPVQAPTKFDFVVNLKAAAGLGVTVPPTLLTLADEVIE
jgi:putative ABC transport system substrate-binding protein